jgi:hypothetical protein
VLRNQVLRGGLFLAFFVVATLFLSITLTHTTYAAGGGGVGGAGNPSGGCSSGSNNCPHTNNGYGWYKYNAYGAGPAAFRSGGDWNSISAQCRSSGNDSVIAFIIQTPRQSPETAWVYNYQSGSYGTYYRYLGDSGGSWLSYGYAQGLYNSLPGYLKVGYTWGSNVAWFCYNFTKEWSINGQSYIQNGRTANKNAAVQGTINAQPGDRLNWYHDMRNNGPDDMDRTVYWNVDKTGFSGAAAGWNANKDPRGNNSGSAGSLFVYEYAQFPSEPWRGPSPYTIYDVRPYDVGNTLCQRIAWNPASWNNGGWGASNYACAYIPYNYTLTPVIKNVSDGSTIDSASGNFSVAGAVTNSGATKSHTDIQYQLTQIVYRPGGLPGNKSGGQDSRDACGYYANSTNRLECNPLTANAPNQDGIEQGGYEQGESKSYTASSTIKEYAVGTQICYVMSVKRSSSSSTNWQHSQLYCFIVNKRPKATVLGGDLIVGRGSATNSARVSQVSTSVSRTASNGYFGSWAEYGIIPTGIVTGMASGSGFVGGASTGDLCGKLSILTLTNSSATGSCSESAIGRYQTTSIAPSTAARFPITTATPRLSGATNIAGDGLSGLYAVTGSTLNITSSGPIPAGRWVVINAKDATVTIGGDIRYTTGDLHSIADIPQVVIIAKNIIIADTVTNIDAWLVAVGSGADGRINTCGAGGVGESTSLTSQICASKLTVNGPVSANHLILRRTAGAGPGPAAGDPAEVFNLRADAYIWATGYSPGTGRLPTVTTKEIPPRF